MLYIDTPEVLILMGLGRFNPGQILITPGAQEALERCGASFAEYLSRHLSGDWGELDDEDRQSNERSVRGKGMLMSSYRLPSSETIWVKTEYGHEITTILLPSEY